MIRSLIRGFNVYNFETFFKSHPRKTTSLCGGIISLSLIVIICILLVLKIIQMVNFGIVTTSSQVNYNLQPILTTISTNMTDQNYAPFMQAFNVEIDNTTCPNAKINFQGFFNDFSQPQNSSNANSSKVPIGFEICTDQHFKMLPGKLKKLNQWTSNSIYCLKLNSYYQIGGANKISNVYKNIRYAFSCPPSCSSSTCGYVQLFSVGANVNLQNASFPYSYQLTRHKFQIQPVPKYQISFSLDANNLTTDTSIFPFALNQVTVSASVGNVIADIPTLAGDPKTYITVQSSDRSKMLRRSYYKLFDLVGYIGGIIYGLFVLFLFIRQLSKVQFELNFAAKYLRRADYKVPNFHSFISQVFYGIVKNTRLRPNWIIQHQRERSRQIVNRILDVLYLNQRIAYLQKAISLIFQKHHLKAIHLLPTPTIDEIHDKLQGHKLRDRLVYYFGEKYRNGQIGRTIQSEGYKKEVQTQKQNSPGKRQKLGSFPTLQTMERLDTNEKEEFVEQKPKKITLKQLISKNNLSYDKQTNKQSDSLIINQAEEYYADLAESRRKYVSVNNAQNNTQLRNELTIVGKMTQNQLNEVQLLDEIENDIKKIVMEGEHMQGHQLSKKIYSRIDDWLKNYIKDTLRQY